jgi:hypothetical protein
MGYMLVKPCSGRMADPFDQAWTIATHKEDLSPDEIRRRFTSQIDR